MSEKSLPSADEAYQALCQKGDWLANNQALLESLGVSYMHPDGNVWIEVDRRVLGATGKLFMENKRIRNALRARGASTGSLRLAFNVIKQSFAKSQLVWGVSGFASPGENYIAEAQFMELCYEFLSSGAVGSQPAFITDGGGGKGVPGLNSLLAPKYNLKTMGFVPYSGLSLLAPQHWTVVHGRSFEDRLKLVGITPDVLMVYGGGSGSKAECLAAVKHGVVVLLLSLKDAGPTSLAATWHQEPELVSAAGRGQLLVCSRQHEIYESIRWCVDAAQLAVKQRPARLGAIAAEFGLRSEALA